MGAGTSSHEGQEALQDLLREAALCERLASGPEGCRSYLVWRLQQKMRTAERAGQLQAWKQLCASAAASGRPNAELSHDLRQLRKQLSGLSVCRSKTFLLDPLFNIDEIRKNAALFEDHLSEDQKVCPECLNKHALLMEAFLDEGLALDARDRKWRDALLMLRPLVYDLRRSVPEGNVPALRRAIGTITQRLAHVCASVSDS
jgi:hypothetical protein